MEHLTQVKGIGRWTAQMFLIFSLGRLDVFPHDDLGVRTAIRNRYGLDDLPDKQTAHAIAAPWRPYASVASWYCWRTLDLDRKPDGEGVSDVEIKENCNGWKRTTDGPQTGDQVRPPAEEDGKEPDRGEDQREEGRSPPVK